MEISLTLPPESRGQRLDQALVKLLPEFTRSQVQRLLREGNIIFDGHTAKAGQKASAGLRVSLSLPPAQPLELLPASLDLNILYEDKHLIIVNKAAGMVVHPAPGHNSGTLVHGLLHHCRDLAGIGGVLRPGIVHRLDKDTSGALVAAKDDVTHQGLVRAFAGGQVKKQYLALVWGHPPTESSIDRPIGRHPVDRKRMSGHSRQGKPALTSWRVAHYYEGPLSLLQISLHTGRTHQIRVHLSEAGFPLLGDATYGRKKIRLNLPGLSFKAARQMLHAHKLAFIHPVSGREIAVSAPVPCDMETVIRQLEPFQLCSAPR